MTTWQHATAIRQTSDPVWRRPTIEVITKEDGVETLSSAEDRKITIDQAAERKARRLQLHDIFADATVTQLQGDPILSMYSLTAAIDRRAFAQGGLVIVPNSWRPDGSLGILPIDRWALHSFPDWCFPHSTSWALVSRDRKTAVMSYGTRAAPASIEPVVAKSGWDFSAGCIAPGTPVEISGEIFQAPQGEIGKLQGVVFQGDEKPRFCPHCGGDAYDGDCGFWKDNECHAAIYHCRVAGCATDINRGCHQANDGMCSFHATEAILRRAKDHDTALRLIAQAKAFRDKSLTTVRDCTGIGAFIDREIARVKQRAASERIVAEARHAQMLKESSALQKFLGGTPKPQELARERERFEMEHFKDVF